MECPYEFHILPKHYLIKWINDDFVLSSWNVFVLRLCYFLIRK